MYLDEKLMDHLRIIEKEIVIALKDDIDSLKDSLDKVVNSYSYPENNRPNNIKEIDLKFGKVVDEINNLKKDLSKIKDNTLQELIVEVIKNNNHRDEQH